MKIICINGQGGVGKDTFVKFCGGQDNGIYNMSMIDCIKDLASSIGWKGTKELRDRKFLSDLKDLIAGYNDYPFKCVLKDIGLAIQHFEGYKWRTKTDMELICFVHAREPGDIRRWRNQYGAKALLIKRKGTNKTYGNHADDDVYSISYDYVIENDDDLSWLKKEADSFIKDIRKEEWESYI